MGAWISYLGAEIRDPVELTNPFCLRPVQLGGWDLLPPGLGIVASLGAGWLPALVAVLVAIAMRIGTDRLVRRLDPPAADTWPSAKLFGRW
ncbi:MULTISPECIES: hypothetical protein [Amycolatopsis methanolica group]|uniref:hypothetical protein n=1 Tax=Amycolatopsis methanolica group TaxID=2893674 RepID=UPI00341CA50C